MTSKKIARTKPTPKRGAKSRKETPLPPGLIEKAAERIGYNPAGLAPEEQAAVDHRRKAGLPVSAFGLAVVRELRAVGTSTEQIAMELRSEARRLNELEEILTPSPEKRDDMLRDALEVIEAAAIIFEHQGGSDDVVSEALRSARDDMELFEAASDGHTGVRPNDMAYLRAQYRIDLALKLADFRKRHPSWKPVRTETENESSEPAKVAS